MSSDDEPVKHEVKENKPFPCFTSLTGSSLLGMISTVSLPSLVHHYWEWFVFFHFMLH
jgi:hypothetical protein